MGIVNTIIIDDEPHCIEALVTKLQDHYPEINILETCRNVEEGLSAYQRRKPDLVFLDINMPGEDGFAFIEKSNPKDCEIVFTTAYDKYAIKAFQFNALNYLLKPVSAEDLKASIERYRERHRLSNSMDQMQTLLDQMRNTQLGLDRIALPTAKGYRYVQINDIIRMESDSNYTRIILKDRSQLLVATTLKEYENMLLNHNFIRVHHSHLINVVHVSEYAKADGGAVVMSDGSSIEISIRKKNDFMNAMAKFHR